MIQLHRKVHKLIWGCFSGILLLALAWLGQTHLSSAPSFQPGDPPKLYSTETNDDLERIFSEAITQATHSVDLIVYTLTDTRILQALKKKANEGIPVRLICNADSAGDLRQKVGKKIRLFLKKGKNQGIMHQKILLIDERKIWIGSANMTPTSLKMHGNLVVGCDHAALGSYIKKKFDQMAKTGSVKRILPQGFTFGNQKLELWFFPDSTKGPDKLKKLIRSAKKSIRVAMFTWTRQDLAEEILAAKERGVEVEIALDRHSSENISAKINKFFIESGIPVLHNQSEGLLHHKCLIIDGEILVNGSANWTYYAFSRNDDCMIILYNLNNEQADFLEAMWREILHKSKSR